MRTPIPEDIAADVLFRHHHTCCVCNIESRPVQIHHIDDNNTNHKPANLTVLCLECHDRTQVRGGFGRKLLASEVIKYKDDWLARVAERKRRVDEIFVNKLVNVPETPPGGTWEAPSERALAALINSLPDTLRAAYEQARPQWDTGNTYEMIEGSRLVIDVLERAWADLAKWYPPNHFGGKPAQEFMRDYIQTRGAWNYAVQEPDGVGTGGSIVRIIASASTATDVEDALAEIVCNIGQWRLPDFNFIAWKQRWENAKKPPPVRPIIYVAGLFRRLIGQ